MNETVVIDCFPSSAARYCDDYAIVAIDVIRATTMAVTAIATGRRCMVAADLDDAYELARVLRHPLLAGELGGDMPDGFDMNNSPADLVCRTDVHRPLVLLSTSGTQLMLEAAKSRHGAYVACFRNYLAVAQHLAGRHRKIAVIGAGSRNEFREEDQMCCAWVAEALIEAGYRAEDAFTEKVVESWSGVPPEACTHSNSVAYLRRSGQLRDFDFIIARINDLDFCIEMQQHSAMIASAAKAALFDAA